MDVDSLVAPLCNRANPNKAKIHLIPSLQRHNPDSGFGRQPLESTLTIRSGAWARKEAFYFHCFTTIMRPAALGAGMVMNVIQTYGYHSPLASEI